MGQLEFDKTLLGGPFPCWCPTSLLLLFLYSVPGIGRGPSVYSFQVVEYVPCSPGVLASHPTSI